MSTLSLYGCETTTHAQEGQVIGAVLGGVIGAQVGDGNRSDEDVYGTACLQADGSWLVQ